MKEMTTVGIFTVTLIVMKLMEVISWSWLAVMSPVWMYFSLIGMSAVYLMSSRRRRLALAEILRNRIQ
jgi:hypothetical protein